MWFVSSRASWLEKPTSVRIRIEERGRKGHGEERATNPTNRNETMTGRCLLLFSLFVARADRPPKSIPPELLSAYTLQDQVPVAEFYVDDTKKGEGTHYKYDAGAIDGYFKSYAARLESWRAFAVEEGLDSNRTMFEETIQDVPKQHWPLCVLDHFFSASSLADKRVVIFGTMEPWAEALCLGLGAKDVTTVEYNDLTFEHGALTTIKPDAFRRRVEDGERWSIALSFSSFDHDGLGRYGDPLVPDGDLQAMKLMRKALEPQGIAFLTLPLGQDLVVWNLHRRYGPLRLPLMLQDWQVLGTFPWDETRSVEDGNFRQTYEPVFVLMPRDADQEEEEDREIDEGRVCSDFSSGSDDQRRKAK